MHAKPQISALCQLLVIRQQAPGVQKKEGLRTPVQPKCVLSATCAPVLACSRAHLGPIGIQQRPGLLLFNSCAATTQKIIAAWHVTT